MTITKIENLSRETTPLPKAEIDRFASQTLFAEKISAKNVSADAWQQFATANDNIQVTWSNGTTEVIRAVNGTLVVDGTTATISGLTNASKYSVGVNGQLTIGPEGNDAAAAIVNIRLGNLISKLNPKGDWIIDFSDKTDEAGGSEINLQVLIDWIKRNTGDSTVPQFPAIKDANGATTKEPKDFIIQFKDFYYNITQKTFDFWVTSKEGQTISFGNFTIKKVGFRVTNIGVNPSLEAPKS
ncbi:hypothetical protein [Chitinophaga rhizophila]|uniref:Uncharacterized protein n=1 Tax=Chitinophaga rhizophila TaxID=2866212 RepID=A0ABS7G5W2_9BACT|nr:hypothetical protein [Chitinophaga rhizophila]MBW8683013.1 hypothetical protein [Chitinophaga rhizophila]